MIGDTALNTKLKLKLSEAEHKLHLLGVPGGFQEKYKEKHDGGCPL